MKNAVIHGETHESREDRKSILSHNLDDFDSIFVEHRDEKFSWNYSPLYLLFIAGYFIHTRLVNRAVNLVGLIIGKMKFWSNNKELEFKNFASKIRNSNAEFEDSIDADIEKFYRMLGKDRYFALILPLIVALPPLYLNNQYYGLILIPFLYFASSAILVNFKGKRDRYMADRIAEISEKQNYENILVICGDSHVEGIEEELSDENWEIDPHRSQHWTRLVDVRNWGNFDV